MTQDEIIGMARQAGIDEWWDSGNEQREVLQKHLETFAKLVADKATEEANARANASWTLMCKKMVEAEREACAKVLDEMAREAEEEMESSGYIDYYRKKATEIRARGQE